MKEKSTLEHERRCLQERDKLQNSKNRNSN